MTGLGIAFVCTFIVGYALSSFMHWLSGDSWRTEREELICAKNRAESEMQILTNEKDKCDLPVVNGCSDTPTFSDWLDKYYTYYRTDDLYKRIDNGKIEPQSELYKHYCKAYEIDNNR